MHEYAFRKYNLSQKCQDILADPDGVTGGPEPPPPLPSRKSQIAIGFLRNTGGLTYFDHFM